MNEADEYIYSIAGGPDGTALYHSVQTAIDAAKADGADYILALGHLGVDPSSAPWTSRDVIAHTTGLDAFIDGHSHTTLEAETVLDKNGEPVILTQTGSYLNAVGRLTISADGTITTELLTGAELADLTPDPTVQAIEDAWIREIDDRLGEVIGFSEITLDNFDADGTRLVRRQPTNSGDFTADALYWFFDSMGLDVDAAVMNGGGIRNGAVTGELSYLTCKEIHTFGNVACLQTVTGQQLLDALEWSVHLLQPDGSYEDGSFLHVSGLRFTVDLTIPSTVQSDPFGVWTGGPTGAYRVRKVEVLDPETGSYVPLDPAASYNLAGYNYTLRDLGGGYAMFEGAVNVLDFAAEDYMVLADYIRSFPANTKTGLPTITAAHGYADLHGSGRITLLTEPAAAQTYIVRAGDSLWRIAREQLGAGSRWREIFEQNRAVIRDPDRIYIGQILQLPA
ncbi:MAG: 5'-nucleotidase C-terminal domain-containing protein [Butyricicoccus sp.]|nr:5'-nucleotidase C-terminal domain-containing protein [Butyricicoccus sp.]